MDGDHNIAQTGADESGPTAGKAGRGEDNRADQLDYIADMIGELQALARNQGAQTLADLLSLTHIEATRAAARNRAGR